MNKKYWLVLAVVVLLIVIVLASSKKQASVSPNDSGILVGIVGPFTGEAGSYGDGIKAGVTLALKEINDAGGVGGKPLQVVYEDDQCNSTGGTNAYNKLVNVDKPTIILGSICSASVAPGAPLAQQAGIPVIEWGSAPDLPKIGDYIFRTYPSDAFQGKFAAEFLYQKLGKRNVAVLYVKNDWGQGINDVFTKRFEELGGTVVFDDSAAQDATDVRTQVTKIKVANPDSIYIPLYPAVGAVAIKQIKNLGLTTLPILSGDASDTDAILKLKEANGVIYTVASIANPDAFKTKIKSATGFDSNMSTPLAYDALHIAAEVINQVGTNQAKIKDALMGLHYTDGISFPVIDFDKDGDLKTAVFDVKVVKDGIGVIYQQ